jgi:hypothetical protein
MLQRGLSRSTRVLGIDVKDSVIQIAKRTIPEFNFENINILQSDIINDKFDLVLAIEVLEHIPHADAYVRKLSLLSARKLIISVPHEPLFQIANFLRGRDMIRLGNHPEHIHHWSPNMFKKFLSPYVRPTRVYRKFPWIIAICNPTA